MIRRKLLRVLIRRALLSGLESQILQTYSLRLIGQDHQLTLVVAHLLHQKMVWRLFMLDQAPHRTVALVGVLTLTGKTL